MTQDPLEERRVFDAVMTLIAPPPVAGPLCGPLSAKE